mgnify:CR=1 FL=1
MAASAAESKRSPARPDTALWAIFEGAVTRTDPARVVLEGTVSGAVCFQLAVLAFRR